MNEDVVVIVAEEGDVVEARKRGREIAAEQGLQRTDLTLVATAISELARNILKYAERGEIVIRPARDGARKGITVVARDDGPGIPDTEQAMTDGFTTGNGLGLGLPGARRLMDDFLLESAPGKGTTVTMTKWTP